MNTFTENALEYLSFGLVFLIPIMFWGHGLFPHISSKTFFMYGVVEVLFFVWLYVLSKNREYRLSKKTMLVFLIPLGFLVWMTLATLFAVNPNLAFWSSLERGTGLLTFYHVYAFALVVASLVQVKGQSYIEELFKYTVFGASLLALSIYMGQDGFNLPMKVFLVDNGGGLSGNSTLAATYLLFALAFGVLLLSRKTVSRTLNIYISCAIGVIIFSPVFINVYGLFSGSGLLGSARGTILSLGAGTLMTGLAYMFFSKKKSVKLASVALFVTGCVAFLVLWIQLVTPTTYLHDKFTEEARGSRFIFWNVASLAIKEHPYFGYGPDNYMIAFQEKFNPEILEDQNSREGWSDRAHNFYYDYGVWGGYPLIILYVLFLVSIIYLLIILEKRNIFSRFTVSVLIGLLVAYMFNNLLTFDSNLSLLVLFTLAGIIYSLWGKSDQGIPLKKKYVHSEYDAFVIGGLGIICVVALIFFVKLPVAKSKAYAETFIKPIDIRAKSYGDLLTGSSVGEGWDVGGLSDEIYKQYAADPAKYKNDAKLLPYIIKDLKGLIDYSEKILERNPTDYRVLITTVHLYSTLIYLENTNPDPTLITHLFDLLDKAKKLAPTNPNVYWNMAQMYVWKGDFKSAENAYREAIAIDPSFAASHRLLIQFAEVIGNTELYTEALKQAEEDIPGFTLKK